MVGAPDTNRTCDPLLRRKVLYPLSYGGASLHFTAMRAAVLTAGRLVELAGTRAVGVAARPTAGRCFGVSGHAAAGECGKGRHFFSQFATADRRAGGGGIGLTYAFFEFLAAGSACAFEDGHGVCCGINLRCVHRARCHF